MNNRTGTSTWTACLWTVCLLLSVFLAACSKPPKLQRPIAAVTARLVSSAPSLPDEARYVATIVPATKVELSFKTNGYVAWIDQRRGADGRMRDLEAGDFVVTGAPLARLRAAEYEASASQADALVKASSAAQAEAEAQLLQARIEAQRAASDWQRAERLFQQTAITRPDFDAAKARDAAAAAQLQVASAALLLQGSKIEDAEAQRRAAKISLGDTILAAPFRGVILSRSVEKGGLAASDSAALVVADIDRVKLSFAVPDTELPKLHLGAQVPVSIDAVRTNSFSGTLTMISPAGDSQSCLFVVEVTLENADQTIRPGMIASVAMPTSARADQPVPTVPLDALVHRGAAYAVFIVRKQGDRSIVNLRTVDPGAIEGNNVAIRSGLQAGMKVVIHHNDDLVDGETVTEVE